MKLNEKRDQTQGFKTVVHNPMSDVTVGQRLDWTHGMSSQLLIFGSLAFLCFVGF